MAKILKIALGIIFLITVIYLFDWFLKRKINVKKELPVNEYVIDFAEKNEKIYIIARHWGLAGNHERILVSLSPHNNIDKTLESKSMTFYTSELYYKKQGLDTLLLYVNASAVPKESKSITNSIKIIQVELGSYDEIKDYELNYEKYGLLKATIYR